MRTMCMGKMMKMMMNVNRLKMPMMSYMITGEDRGGNRTAHDMII